MARRIPMCPELRLAPGRSAPPTTPPPRPDSVEGASLQIDTTIRRTTNRQALHLADVLKLALDRNRQETRNA